MKERSLIFLVYLSIWLKSKLSDGIPSIYLGHNDSLALWAGDSGTPGILLP